MMKPFAASASKVVLLYFASFFLAHAAYALDISDVSASTMIINFAESVPNLMRLTTAIAYVLGIYMVIHGVVQMKRFGDMRTQMSQEHSIKGPIIFVAVGAALLYLPSSVQAGFTTFWTDPTPYAYQTSDSGPFTEFVNACFLIIQLVGTIYFIKGLVMMTNLNSHGQGGGFSRAMTHIIGGIFCIDFYDFINMIMVTLGLGSLGS